MRSTNRCGESSSYREASTYGSPNSTSHEGPWSVVPWKPRSSHSDAWVTMPLKRSVWPATQLAM